MQYVKRERLTILELKDGDDSIPMERLKAVLQTVLSESLSSMIYCENAGRLSGIVSAGDIWRAVDAGRDSVAVNRSYVWVSRGEYWKARGILKMRGNISAIPVIGEGHSLVGGYTRWDDLLAVDNMTAVDREEDAGKWEGIQRPVLVRPGQVFTDRWKSFEKFREYLRLNHVEARCIGHQEVPRYLEAEDAGGAVLFVDEDEMLSCHTYLMVVFGMDMRSDGRLMTYRGMLEDRLRFRDRVCSRYLRRLHEEGVRILGLECREGTYQRRQKEEIEGRFLAMAGRKPRNRLPEAMYQDFFDDLYSEEYADDILNMPIGLANNGGVFRLRDCRSPYYNVEDGERNTVGQPARYRRSIYFYGGCYIYGMRVEDRNTIESFLQERICSTGGEVRVVNCGFQAPAAARLYLTRIAATRLKKGDIIVIDRPPEGIQGVAYLDLNQVLEEKGAPARWFVNDSLHCNHKVNRLYADAIYDALAPVLAQDSEGCGGGSGEG